MPEFSACYFCGTALDAPLSECPVVPKGLQPAADQQRTVVLCPTCRRKLGAVVDTVVQAIDDAPETDSIQQELVESPGNGKSSVAEAGELTAERLDDDAEVDDARADDGGFEFQDQDRSAESSSESAEEGAGATGADGTDSDVVGDAERDPLATEERSPAASDAEGEAKEGTGEGQEGTAERQEGAAEEGTAEEDANDEEDDEEPRMTALEYNKVMRLLQNREFPVDKAEFKVVATNAYQIDDDEFEAVIEAAEKRDLIAVENGQIVDAD